MKGYITLFDGKPLSALSDAEFQDAKEECRHGLLTYKYSLDVLTAMSIETARRSVFNEVTTA